MAMWLMSDRAIPRSFRMMEGFGVHTFRLINEQGKRILLNSIGNQYLVYILWCGTKHRKYLERTLTFTAVIYGNRLKPATFRNTSWAFSFLVKKTNSSLISMCWTLQSYGKRKTCPCRSLGK